jgi:hypothetical protein
MVAAQIDSVKHARLHFITGYLLKIAVGEVRLVAIRLDNLTITEVGNEDVTVPDPSRLVNFSLFTGTATNLGRFLKDG